MKERSLNSYSALARLQQTITLSVLLGASGWLVWHWDDSVPIALIGFVAIALGYCAVLAFEFVALWFVGRSDAAIKPSVRQLIRAWAGETIAAPRVFCWRQPFRWRREPDFLDASARGRRGVVFIHGFVCNRGFWNPWLARLRNQGHAYVAVNLEPVFGSIDEYLPIIDDAVRQVTRATGLTPVLVCHSMGGLAARGWLCASRAEDRVHHVITIASPHRGTWLGQFGGVANGRQMGLGSPWLSQLDRRAPSQRYARFTCWYSNCDNIVFPVSTATLPGADNRLVRGPAHVELAFHREVMSASLALITAKP